MRLSPRDICHVSWLVVLLHFANLEGRFFNWVNPVLPGSKFVTQGRNHIALPIGCHSDLKNYSGIFMSGYLHMLHHQKGGWVVLIGLSYMC